MNALPSLDSSAPASSLNEETLLEERTLPLFPRPLPATEAILENRVTTLTSTFYSLKERIGALFTSCWPRLEAVVSSALPTDPDLKIRRLENGLTYYLRSNAYPHPQKAALRLVVRTGHLNETKEERGYAHMVEHLTQIATTHFAPREIDHYLESLGVNWGGDNNAYTSSHETVYMLEIPLDDPEALDKTLYILSEVAQQATLTDEMIETERAVVIDELKQRRGSPLHYCKKIWQHLLQGTPYPDLLERDAEIRSIEQCSKQGIRDFYKRWYQPQNMALVAVGDFDTKQAESLIKKHFAPLTASPTPAKLPPYLPAPKEETRYSCFSDPEWTGSIVEIYYKLPFVAETGVVDRADIKRSLLQELASSMLNARLDEIEESESPPFLKAGASKFELIRDCHYYRCAAQAQEGRLQEALAGLLLEIKRVKEHGFTEEELKRVKQSLMAHLEHALQEKDRTRGLIESYQNHFLEQTPLPNRARLLEEKIKLCPTVSLQEVNRWIHAALSRKDRFILASTPDKPNLANFDEKELQRMVEETEAQGVEPYEYKAIEGSLMATLPQSGRIASVKRHEKSQVVEFVLENGCRVLFKPTSFEKDHFAISAQAIYGIRDVPLAEQAAAKFADDFYTKCGLGDFDLIDLRKILNEKNISLHTRIGHYTTDIKTVSGIKDLETAFQVLHLLFTNPGYQQTAFEKALREEEEYLRNRPLNPNNQFTDAIIGTNTQNHPEMKPLALEDLATVDYETTKRIHQQAFSRPADFSFVIVGNADEAIVKEQIERYIASLPQERTPSKERAYTPVPFPAGITRKEIFAGKESGCTTFLTFPAPLCDTRSARRFANWSCELVETRLQEVLRKQMGKSYTPSCYFLPTPIPDLNPIHPSKSMLRITCDPQHLKEVEEALFREIASLHKEGPTQEELESAKAQFLLQRRQALNTNSGWLHTLMNDALWNHPPDEFELYQEDLDAFDCKAAQECIQQIFPLENYTLVTLYPEKKET